MKCALLALLSVVCVQVVQSDNWAVLVAGSRGYYNYRHQADVCHAYQLLSANGFSDDRIITMFYDDIAFSPENPVQGELINQPNGPNVYTNCKKDYTGKSVTPENFLNVLQGKETSGGSGKVLESGEDDDVFVFFADHGGTGLIAFPSDELVASKLNDALVAMNEARMFRQLLFYVEACESGSMFSNILSDKINVRAVTASDPAHSSYAIYFDKTRKTYLGDVFSVYWMQNSETDEATETIAQQIAIVAKETNTSTVCTYGDSSIDSEALTAFQSTSGNRALTSSGNLSSDGEVVDSRDVVLATMRHNMLDATSDAERSMWAERMANEMARRAVHDRRMREIAASASVMGTTSSEKLLAQPTKKYSCEKEAINTQCLEAMVKTFKQSCGPFDDYSLKHVRVLNNLCNASIYPSQMAATFQNACSEALPSQ